MKKIACCFMIITLVICAACGTNDFAEEKTSIELVPKGLTEGVCDGIGSIQWDMNRETVLAMDNTTETSNKDIIISDIEFADCAGNLICTFKDDRIAGLSYSFENGNPYDNYERLLKELTAAYGQSKCMVNIADSRANNEYKAQDLWTDIPTSKGGKVTIVIDMKPPAGWIVVSFMSADSE